MQSGKYWRGCQGQITEQQNAILDFLKSIHLLCLHPVIQLFFWNKNDKSVTNTSEWEFCEKSA